MTLSGANHTEGPAQEERRSGLTWIAGNLRLIFCTCGVATATTLAASALPTSPAARVAGAALAAALYPLATTTLAIIYVEERSAPRSADAGRQADRRTLRRSLTEGYTVASQRYLNVIARTLTSYLKAGAALSPLAALIYISWVALPAPALLPLAALGAAVLLSGVTYTFVAPLRAALAIQEPQPRARSNRERLLRHASLTATYGPAALLERASGRLPILLSALPSAPALTAAGRNALSLVATLSLAIAVTSGAERMLASAAEHE